MAEVKIDMACKINSKFDKKLEVEETEQYINYDTITTKFYEKFTEKEKEFIEANYFSLSKKEDINFEYIRYFDNNIRGWLLLNENDIISLRNKQKLELLLKIRIKTNEEENILNQYKEIGMQIEDLENNKKKKKANNDNNNISIDEYSDIDISVLTANPLIDKDTKKELRTINDYNNITNSIRNAISTNLVYAEFYPLTIRNLKKVINNKPKIVHLICKSTYILPEKIEDEKNFHSYNYVNLLFEDDEYFYTKKINKEILDTIFGDKVKEIKEIKEKIKNIVLIISTEFSQDVFEMVKDYGFRNVLVEHTTVADSLYISDFNEQFYRNIIMNNNDENDKNSRHKILDFFDEAKNINITKEGNQFCCCFHNHNIDCEFMKNVNNELYVNKNEINDKNVKDTQIQKKNIFHLSHFSHLRYQCKCNNEIFLRKTEGKRKKGKKILVFDCHSNSDCENQEIKINNELVNICCCHRIKKDEKILESKNNHLIDNIFSNDFKEKNNEIQLGDENSNYGVIKNDFLPDYEKMKFIVGRNNVIYEIYKRLFESNNKLIINVYNNGKQNFELMEIADIIIEYFKERIYLLYKEEKEEKNRDLDSRRAKTSKNVSESNVDLNINNALIHSHNFINKQKKDYNFEKINTINECNFNRMKDGKSNIYVIIIFEEKLINDILDKIGKNNNLFKIILFTVKKIDKYKNIKIENIEIKPLKGEDYEIKYQIEKIKKKKEQFKELISLEMVRNSDLTIKNNDESTINYEILFLFNNISSEINEVELKYMYKIENIQDVLNSINKKFENFNKLINDIFNDLIENIEDKKDINEKEKDIDIDKSFALIKEIIQEKFYKIKDIIVNNRIYSLEDLKEKNINLKEIVDNNFKKSIQNINEKMNKIINNKYNIKDIKERMDSYIKEVLNEIEKFEKNEFYTIKEILDNIFVNKIIIKAPKFEYKKINNNFNLYYDNLKNKISDEIKQNILLRFFKYYSVIFHYIIFKWITYYVKDYSTTTIENIKISLIDELNKWPKDDDFYKEPKEGFHFYDYYKSFDVGGRNFFNKEALNFSKMFNNENINICMKNSEVWNKVLGYIKKISVSYFICLMIYGGISDLKNKYFIFKEIFETFEKENNLIFYTRLIFMRWMDKTNLKNLDKYDIILDKKTEKKCKKEDIDKEFSEFIINNIKENIKNTFSENIENISSEESFLKIFIKNVKYIYYKFKIKNGITDTQDLEEFYKKDVLNDKNEIIEESIVKIFRNEKSHLYEIKTYLLIGEWYKYNENIPQEEKNKYYDYLNFAIYVCNYYKNENRNYIDYYIKENNLINKKITKEENKIKSIEKIKKLCHDYKFNEEFNDNNNLEFYSEETA